MTDSTGIQSLAARVNMLLPLLNVTTQRMVGAITFLLNGSMLCCVSKNALMVRVRHSGDPMPGNRAPDGRIYSGLSTKF